MTGDPGVDEELVLVDQIQPVQLGRELAATEVLMGIPKGANPGGSAGGPDSRARQGRVCAVPGGAENWA